MNLDDVILEQINKLIQQGIESSFLSYERGLLFVLMSKFVLNLWRFIEGIDLQSRELMINSFMKKWGISI